VPVAGTSENTDLEGHFQRIGLCQVTADSGRDPTVIIRPGAEVQGELRFERKVQLFVSDHATIGTVTGATAVIFSSDNPPSAR
jgi:hypothetical protein